MATYLSVYSLLGQLGSHSFDRLCHAPTYHKRYTSGLLCRRICYRSAIWRRLSGLCRRDGGLGMLTRWLLLEHVVSGAQTRRSYTIDSWESRIHRMSYARCVCTLHKSLYSTVRAHWVNIFCWCHGDRTWNRLLQSCWVKRILVIYLE